MLDVKNNISESKPASPGPGIAVTFKGVFERQYSMWMLQAAELYFLMIVKWLQSQSQKPKN
jgi:hypothetical protein